MHTNIHSVSPAATSNKMLWSGRILSGAIALLFLANGAFCLSKPAGAAAGMAKFGWPESALPVLGTLMILCAVVYAIPRTTILGAILLTGYLGGATATHVRLVDPMWVVPVITGVLVWLGVWLRDARLRSLIPLS